jgi:DNA-directed RNA polymerase subunit RPC12/RpoP
MRDLEACKIGDNLYLCAQCGDEVAGEHFDKYSSICHSCVEENGERYDDDDDYDDDYGDDD